MRDLVPRPLQVGRENRQGPHLLKPSGKIRMRLRAELDLHCPRARQVRKKRNAGDGEWPAHKFPISEFAVERVIREPEIGASRLRQTFQHFVWSVSLFPIRDIDQNGGNEGVGRSFPASRVNASSIRIRDRRVLLDKKLKMSDDIRRVHNNDLIVDQSWHLDAPVHVF